MKRKILLTIGAALLLAALMLLASCQGSPYEDLSEDGYNVCVRFDANGGDFANNGKYMTIVDVYHSSAESIRVYAPDDKIRQPKEIQYDVQKSMSNYKLEGWYVVPTNENGDILDEDGNPCKTSKKQPAFGKKWDFENDRFTPDKNKTYTRENPALTLCAKWIPHYSFEFYIEDSDGAWVQFTNDGKELEYSGNVIRLPRLITNSNEQFTGKKHGYGNWTFYSEFNPIGSDQLPIGYTFTGAYLDEACTDKISYEATSTDNRFDGTSYYNAHPELDPLIDPIKIYTKWEEGNWFSIFNADQFSVVAYNILDGTLKDVKMRIMNDLDFGTPGLEFAWLLDDLNEYDKIWSYTSPDYKGFNLYIDGQGHSFKNINAEIHENTDDDYSFGGIFNAIGKNSEIFNLTIENSTFTVPDYKGTDTASFGLFAGNIIDGAKIENVVLKDCTIVVGTAVLNKVLDGTVNIYVTAPQNTDGVLASDVNISVPEGYKATVSDTDGFVTIEKITV